MRPTIWLTCATLMLVNCAGCAPDIFQAVTQGNVSTVDRLLARNPGLVRAREGKQGLTPLHVAAKYGHLQVVRTLLKHGAEVNATDKRGATPLFYAVESDQVAIARELLSHDAEVNIALEFQVAGVSAGNIVTPLLLAVRRNNPQMVQLLLERGAHVKGAGSTAFFAAISSGRVEMVRMLLKAGADPLEHEKHWGATPLHVAAGNGHCDVMDVLSSYYKSVDVRDNLGRTPLHFAAMGGKSQAVAWLIRRGANVRAQDQGGATALMYASGGGHTSVVQMLLRHGSNVQIKDSMGETALHYACRVSEDRGAAVAALLLRYGADCNARNNFGVSPLQEAARRGNRKCVEVLRKYGAHE